MHFSAQHTAALAVAFLSTRTVASGVKAAPVPRVKLGNGMPAGGNGLSAPIDGLTGDFARAYGPNHAAIKGNQKREPEPEPFNFGSLIKDGEQILGNVLKRETEPFNSPYLAYLGHHCGGTCGTIVPTKGSQKREPEPEPFNFGNLIKDGEQILGSVLKREPVPEPEPFNFGSLIKDGEQILGSVL